MNSLEPPASPPLGGCGRGPHCALLLSGGPGAVDRERGPDPGGQRPVLSTAQEPRGAHPQLHHPADLPLHLREQAHGHHRAGKGCQGRLPGDSHTWGQPHLGQPHLGTARGAHLAWPPALGCHQSTVGQPARAGLSAGQSTPSLGSTRGDPWKALE